MNGGRSRPATGRPLVEGVTTRVLRASVRAVPELLAAVPRVLSFRPRPTRPAPGTRRTGDGRPGRAARLAVLTALDTPQLAEPAADRNGEATDRSHPHSPRTDPVIILTRLGGHEMAVNPDLIERAEATPDTVITMVDGHKLVVAESLTELVTRVRHWRASVAAEAYLTARSQGLRGPVAAPPMSEGEDPESVDGHVSEISAADVIAHGLSSSAMARVLRMPKREG